MFNKEEFLNSVEKYVKSQYGKNIANADKFEKYYAVSKAAMDTLVDDWESSKEAYSGTKQAAYLSAEFLMGRVFSNNLLTMGLLSEIKEVIEELGLNINELEEMEDDAGLGNGGLGRLAACFMDSCATLNMPVTGYGIFYNYGLFKQNIDEGFQKEQIDNWLKRDNPWYVRKDTEQVVVDFADYSVKAVPYDTPILGFETKNINTLRLWQAEPMVEFDYEAFNEQEYIEAFKQKNEIENISRILYPNDSKQEGKLLRLRQQYFFVSASLQEMVTKYKEVHGTDMSKFHEYYAIQLNDTHPVVAIPELMRIFMDVEGMTFEDAFEVVKQTVAYTNHTILAEALEQWDCSLFEAILPRILEITKEIAKRFEVELQQKGYSTEKIQEFKIIDDNRIKMAHLAIHASMATNGVARLHTDILINEELKDWYELYPERFNNKTNGITPRRWIALANPELTDYITELLGDTSWINELDKLKGLEKFADDEEVLKKFLAIKDNCKN